MGRLTIVVALVAVLVGYLIGTSPAGVTPPTTPPGSPTGMLPPWPIFRVAIALNEFFEAAAVATRPPPVQVKTLATAYWQSEISYSLTKSGAIDAVGEGGVACEDVAAKLKLVPDFLCRMMRAGEGIKLLSTDAQGKYSLTPAGHMLRSDHPGSLRSFMLMINEETTKAWRAAGTKSLSSGQSGFKEAFGKEWWAWHNEQAHATQMRQFDAAMRSLNADVSGALLIDWAPPAEDALVCDIGGGAGHMTAAMAHHYPKLKGIVFDQPKVVASSTKETLAELGVSDRVSAIGGSFLEPLPAALSSCDAFYLQFILHDWADEDCVKILSAIKAVAKEGSQIVTTDFILGVDGANMEMAKRNMDINMMAVNPPGAGERTFEEYSALFARAGFAKPSQLVKLRDIISTVVTEV